MSSKYLAHPTWNFIHASAFNKLDYTLKNLKKLKALRMWQVWCNKPFLPSWKPNKSYMPDTIKCYIESPKSPAWIQIPPGLRSTIPFESHYDNQVIEFPKSSITMHDYQELVVNQLSTAKVWLIQSGAWSGKTIIIIEGIRALQRKALIVMKDITLMAQMVKDIQTFLWITPVQISWKVYSKKKMLEWDDRITVVSIESRDKIQNLNEFGTIFLDEAHCYFSDARREWLWSLSPEYMFWLTATPKVNDLEDKVFDIYFWKKIITTGISVHTPNYNQVISHFNFQIDDTSQFHELEEALYASERRNQLIADVVCRYIPNKKWLVFCKQIIHAKTIQAMLDARWIKTYLMIGEVSLEEREKIRNDVIAYKWSCVIIGSVQIIGTWFNIPELSFALLTIPVKFSSSIEQFVGRLSRVYEWKPQAEFFEITDHLVPLLNRQSISRVRTYKQTYPNGKIKICNLL